MLCFAFPVLALDFATGRDGFVRGFMHGAYV